MIKCKQSVEGSIMSQIFHLSYSYGIRDVSETELIYKNTISSFVIYKAEEKRQTIWHDNFRSR